MSERARSVVDLCCVRPGRHRRHDREADALNGVPESARHFHVNTAARPNKWEVWINARGVPIKFRSLETGGAIDFTLVSAPEQIP
ncbi:hypothetical protein [Phenylobacterium sp.]|uniref:hypothetical protein n=1 Tax=Phenylobacterium sp. TaxID=1871053 RepID=UPI002E37DBDC|nr:hypothetical protein [Phenylobacterium sp.]HEX3367629.1 hypothetical protein [Phenylobacterium sp.]